MVFIVVLETRISDITKSYSNNKIICNLKINLINLTFSCWQYCADSCY